MNFRLGQIVCKHFDLVDENDRPYWCTIEILGSNTMGVWKTDPKVVEDVKQVDPVKMEDSCVKKEEGHHKV